MSQKIMIFSIVEDFQFRTGNLVKGMRRQMRDYGWKGTLWCKRVV